MEQYQMRSSCNQKIKLKRSRWGWRDTLLGTTLAILAKLPVHLRAL